MVTRLPSDTLRRDLQKVLLTFRSAQQFEQWVNSTINFEPSEWVAADGKKALLNSHRTRHGISNFILVSLSSRQGIVLKIQQFESKHDSRELKVA